MDGVQKMLQSQQLTFAFVGVAPSLIILYGVAGWLRSLFGRTITGRKRATKAERRQAWMTMRSIDKLVPTHLTPSKRLNLEDDQRLGLLLIQLQALRTYATEKGGVLSNDATMRREFLTDVRALERSTDSEQQIRIVSRMWTTWAPVLRWSEF